MTPSPPLHGIRILDLTQLLPGPLCTLHLADLGAEVIKVEAPQGGDPTRGLAGEQFNALFLMLNRNKRSITLDLRAPEGVQALHRLVAGADVLVEGFRPGVAARLGIGYETLAAIHPKLVYCSITGYGQDGPLAQAAGHDINYECLAGVLEQTGSAHGAPAQGNFPVADLAGGSLSAAMAILAALLGTRSTGRGTHIDIAMTDCLMAHNIMSTLTWQRVGQSVPRGMDYLSGGIACYGVYETADGRHLAVGAIEPKFWLAFCHTIQRPDLSDKGHVGGQAGQEARSQVAAIIREKPLDAWVKLFAETDACVTPVLRIDEAVSHPHAQARGLYRTAEHPVAGTYPHYACPIRMSGYPLDAVRPAPGLGADNPAILGT